jgi:hypothetical protein
MIAILRERIKNKKLQKKKTIPEKIGIGISIFVLIIKGAFFFAVQQTSAYEKALVFIKRDQNIQKEIGAVGGVFLVPAGNISIATSSQGTTGNANLDFIVKGSKKYMDLNLLMDKELETDWKIEIDQ